jgi:hypothetical protein
MTLLGQVELPTSIHVMFRAQRAEMLGKTRAKPAVECSPKAEATGSNPVGCASFPPFSERHFSACPSYVRVTSVCAPSVPEVFA